MTFNVKEALLNALTEAKGSDLVSVVGTGRGQLAVTKYLKKQLGIKNNDFKNAVYFDGTSLVHGDKTVVPGALTNKTMTVDDLVSAVKKHMNEDNTNDVSDDGDEMDKVQPNALKKKFKDRKDKDIDNDGDVDSSDKYLHNRRKAVSKAIDK